MKIFRKYLTAILIFLLIFQGIKIYSNLKFSNNSTKEENKRLQESAEILNKCFDLENKSKRSLSESLNLIEYCMKEYRSYN